METSFESNSESKHLNGSSSYSTLENSKSNGDVCNGYSEKKHKDHKHKEKDKKHKSHKHEKDRDKSHKSKDRDKDREKDKEKSHKSSSSNNTTSTSEKDRDRSKYDKNSSKSSSEKSPEKSHKSKHKDKHREKDRSDKKSSSSSNNNNTSNSSPRKSNDIEVKSEPVTPIKKEPPPSMASPATDSEDDVPLGHRQSLNSTHTQLKHSVVKKEEEDSDEDDVPLSNRKSKNDTSSSSKKRRPQSDSDEDVPLIHRKKTKTETKPRVKKRARSDSEDSEEEYNAKKKAKSKAKASSNKSKTSSNKSTKSSPASANSSPTKKGRKAKEEEEEVWKWWEEEKRDDGVKWNFLEHKGPVFAAAYEPLPKSVNFRYNGKPLKLSEEAEEVAGFYSRFIEHDYTTKEKFNTNFFKDWRKCMTKSEKELITDLRKCDFSEINEYYKQKSEERKAMSKDEKLKIKEENEAIQKEYGTCVLDGHKEKIGNFRIEPPGLFRGRGEHPKMGMLKRRVMPEDVTINCSKTSKYPVPPAGHKWKEVRHDNTVTWLACWTENVQGQSKYVMLNPTSRLKGEKDWMKYETARKLAKKIDRIRENYRNDFKSKEMRVRQRAVALYFIDKLALRAGNEKDEDQADTVGCCSLRYEHIQLHDEKDGKENVVVFDFLGKDSIRYLNEVEVEKRVFKNLKIFMDNKKEGDDLFDRLNTAILNKHLSELMDGLTAKVFRTYNASHTLQEQLDELTVKDSTVAQKILAYNRANRKVAILCNHQRAVPKSHEKSMENLINKIESKKEEVKNVKRELKGLSKGSKEHEKKATQLERLKSQLEKLELNRQDKDEGKEVALGTSKLNYLDPRITAAWCKKHDVPLEKVYNKTQRAKFRWAIDMINNDNKEFRFD